MISFFFRDKTHLVILATLETTGVRLARPGLANDELVLGLAMVLALALLALGLRALLFLVALLQFRHTHQHLIYSDGVGVRDVERHSPRQ